jgi:hypothetical protein
VRTFTHVAARAAAGLLWSVPLTGNASRVAGALTVLLLGCSGKITQDLPAGSGAAAAVGGAGAGAAANGGAGAGKATGGTSGSKGGSSGASSGGTSGGGAAPTDAACEAQTGSALKLGRSRLSRLTRTQLDHTLRDLLGVTDNPSAALTPDQSVGPFASNALAVPTDLIVQQHQELAAKVALGAKSRQADIAGCDLASGDDCVRKFVTSFGLKAYRRPLLAEEVDAYAALFGVATNASDGFRLVLEAMLQSPFFLYHADVGTTGAPSETPVALTPYELAARLAYFLWDSMPDQTLFDLAAAGGLDDDGVLAAQVSRMLADTKAKDAVPLFHLQWLDIGASQLGSLASAKPALVDDMLAETTDFVNAVVLSGDGSMSTLFTAPYSYPRGDLFGLYGVDQPSGFKAGTQVMLDTTKRGGLLTQPGFLVKHYRGDAEGSVVHRGIAIRENLLCTPIDPPPPDVNATALPPANGTTARDRFKAHETGTCAGCHAQMDPIGLAFENFDGLGRYRTLDGGVTIDATGEVLDAGPELEGQFNGIVELGKKLAGSRTIADCLANQWFRFALGRIESADDACSLKSVHERFAESKFNVRELITATVLSDAFRHVRAIGAQEKP